VGTLDALLSQSDLWWSDAVILVLLGTNPHPFGRLFDEVKRIAVTREGRFIVQAGTTPFDPKPALECYSFVEKEQIFRWINEADVVICQGGFGSIHDCLRAGKKVISVPRKPELNESTDGQEELVRALDQMGYLIGVFDVKDLEGALDRVEKFTPKPLEESRIPKIVSDYVHGLLGII